jgi:hypothetical protein
VEEGVGRPAVQLQYTTKRAASSPWVSSVTYETILSLQFLEVTDNKCVSLVRHFELIMTLPTLVQQCCGNK